MTRFSSAAVSYTPGVREVSLEHDVEQQNFRRTRLHMPFDYPPIVGGRLPTIAR